MHEKSVSHTRIQDFFFGGGGREGCLKTTLTIFLVRNFNSLHFTVIERRSRVRACPHSSERLILGGGYSYIFIHMISPRALIAKSAAILKNLASFKNESPSTKIGVQDCQSAVSESSDDAMFLYFFVSSQLMGAQWLSVSVLVLRLRGCGFEPHRCHCVMSLSKNINPGLVLFQPRKIHL